MRRLLYIVILFIITGCGISSVKPEVLDEAQSLMLSDPSAALSKLNGVDVSEFEDSATMARWALLYSEAMVANRLSAPTDTIVNIAIDYYGHHGLLEEFNKASRLKALINAGDDSDALATALYLQKEKEFFLYRERVKRETYTFFGIIILLIAFGMIVWMRQRMKLQTLLNETLMAEASGLQERIESGKDDICRLEAKLHGLLENRFALIDSLCQTYYETQGTKTERKAIIEKVKDEIDAVRSDSLSEMEQTVNDCRDNILVRVKEKYPDIKNVDYQLLVYLASGLSSRTISLLMGESVDVIYKRKSRLKSRLKIRTEHIYPQIMDIF
ncbi:MAG: hypothetical protein K2K37_12320 [Muribaculaceae bacterium]|nr:hypothetical protein [Muribaculaceae bacterium]